MDKFNRSWAEVNLDLIAHNFKELRRITNKNAKMMAVVKADAYGHGSIEVSKTLIENGADMLAVAMLDEAIQLRNAGLSVPILILGHTIPEKAKEIIKYDLIQTVFQHDIAEALSYYACTVGRRVKVHVKVDTGMTRVGFRDSQVESILDIAKLPNIELEGIMTHFASADDSSPDYTKMQFQAFMEVVQSLDNHGLRIPIKHTCNSAAIIQFPEMHLDMVRPGISLYGFYPSKDVDVTKVDLRQAITFKTRAVMVKDVEVSVGISYGTIFKTERPSKIVTIPIGYADGYTRLLTGKGKVLVNGQIAPIVGKICMDQCMIDATDVSGEINLGDEVVMFGSQGNKQIHVDDVADMLGTINYEVVCMVGKRIPRMYYKDGIFSGEMNYLV